MSRKTFVEFDRQCEHCQKVFTVTSRKPLQRFCGRQCFNESQRSQVNVTCPICSKNFSVVESRLKNNVMGLYCSHECYGVARRGMEPANKDRTQRSCGVCGSVFECTKNSQQKYCTSACFHEAHTKYMYENPSKPRNKVERTCKQCGKVFGIWPSHLKRKDMNAGQFCSKPCMSEWQRSITGESHPLKKQYVAIECESCGKIFSVKPALADRTKFCSKPCADKKRIRLSGKEHPRYTRIALTCQWCGKEYKKIQSMAARSRFCCRACQGSYMVANTQSPTTIEISISRLLDSMNIEYISQAQIDFYVCDFYVPSCNLVIETDGTYWHSLPQNIDRDNRKNSYLANKGYSLLRLPEEKIRNDLKWCENQIISAIHQESVQELHGTDTKHVRVNSRHPTCHQAQLSFGF